MKKLVYFALTTLPFLANSVYAQIPNGGFETWNSMGAYENPASWATMNNTTATYSLFTATKATPGSPGSSYMKLTSKTINGSVVPGVAVCGKLDTLTKQPISGVPYTQRSATFGGKWQHMIFGSSQGSVMVMLTKWNATQSKRDTIASAAQTLAGMAMSWSNFSMNLAYVDSLRYPDSCLIVLRASGSAPTNNDYLWVDNLAFTGTVAVYQPPVTTGIHDHSATDAIRFNVFPNPAKDVITINLSTVLNSNTKIQITDITGKVVREIIPTPEAAALNSLTIETDGLEKGIYTLTIKSGNSIGSSKLLIE